MYLKFPGKLVRDGPFNFQGGLWVFSKKYSDFGGGKK
jgi:hypothetical protein